MIVYWLVTRIEFLFSLWHSSDRWWHKRECVCVWVGVCETKCKKKIRITHTQWWLDWLDFGNDCGDGSVGGCGGGGCGGDGDKNWKGMMMKWKNTTFSKIKKKKKLKMKKNVWNGRKWKIFFHYPAIHYWLFKKKFFSLVHDHDHHHHSYYKNMKQFRFFFVQFLWWNTNFSIFFFKKKKNKNQEKVKFSFTNHQLSTTIRM